MMTIYVRTNVLLLILRITRVLTLTHRGVQQVI